MRKLCLSASLLIFLFVFMISITLATPGVLNYQGKLTQGDGTPLDGIYRMTFSIYDSITEGIALWSENRDVLVTNGIYNVSLGSVSPFPASLFVNDSLYLEVTILNPGTEEEETLSPRQRLTSVAFAMKAADSDTLNGHSAMELDQSNHVDRTDNPHGVTAAQVGAVSTADFTWSKLGGIPQDIVDGDQVGITSETDPTVPSNLKDESPGTKYRTFPMASQTVLITIQVEI